MPIFKNGLFFRIKITLSVLIILVIQLILISELQANQRFSHNRSQNKTYRQIRDLNDFIIHINLHQQRVLRLAMYLFDTISYQSNPYGLVPQDREVFRSFILLHDVSKVSDLEITKKLFQFYGLNSLTLNLKEKNGLAKLVGLLNTRDNQVATNFFFNHGLYFFESGINSKSKLFLEIEKVADAVDRGSNQISSEEFGRKLTLASQYLNAPLQIQWSRILERHYKTLTQDLWFDRAQYCNNLFF